MEEVPDWKKRLIPWSSLGVAKERLQARKTGQLYLDLNVMYFCNPFKSTGKTRKSFRNNNHKLTKDGSFLTNLTALYDEMVDYGDKGRAVGIRYLTFHKTFDTTFHSFPNCKWRKHELDQVCIRCAEN